MGLINPVKPFKDLVQRILRNTDPRIGNGYGKELVVTVQADSYPSVVLIIFHRIFHQIHYGKGKLYQFEDMQLMGPEDADKVLSQMYGDYMKEPEECDRNVHDAQLVEQQA